MAGASATRSSGHPSSRSGHAETICAAARPMMAHSPCCRIRVAPASSQPGGGHRHDHCIKGPVAHQSQRSRHPDHDLWLLHARAPAFCAALRCPVLTGPGDPTAPADQRMDATRNGRSLLLFLARELDIRKTRGRLKPARTHPMRLHDLSRHTRGDRLAWLELADGAPRAEPRGVARDRDWAWGASHYLWEMEFVRVVVARATNHQDLRGAVDLTEARCAQVEYTSTRPNAARRTGIAA
jgi:hypothetical protein